MFCFFIDVIPSLFALAITCNQLLFSYHGYFEEVD